MKARRSPLSADEATRGKPGAQPARQTRRLHPRLAKHQPKNRQLGQPPQLSAGARYLPDQIGAGYRHWQAAALSAEPELLASSLLRSSPRFSSRASPPSSLPALPCSTSECISSAELTRSLLRSSSSPAPAGAPQPPPPPAATAEWRAPPPPRARAVEDTEF